MKRGTPQHPKTTELATALGIEIWGAVGILEMLWHWTAQYAPAGDVGRFQNATIAAHIGWRGDADVLVNALVQTRWLDADDEFRLIIHDWSEHAEDSVHRALARRVRLFADGSTPNLSRFSSAEKKELSEKLNAAKQESAKSAPDVRPACAQDALGVRPSQSQSQSQSQSLSQSQSQSRASRARATPGGSPDAPAPAPPAHAAPVLPVAHELADLIEAHPKARKSAGSPMRRDLIAQRIAGDGAEWVAQAIRWICTTDSADARRLASQLARFEDAVEVHGEVDRLEAAHRLMDELGDTTDEHDPPDEPRRTRPPRPRFASPAEPTVPGAARFCWEAVDPANARHPVPERWQQVIQQLAYRVGDRRAYQALRWLADPQHRPLLIEFAADPDALTIERLLDWTLEQERLHQPAITPTGSAM